MGGLEKIMPAYLRVSENEDVEDTSFRKYADLYLKVFTALQTNKGLEGRALLPSIWRTTLYLGYTVRMSVL